MSSIAFNQNPEDNPFADPFARSNSPDPWNSYATHGDAFNPDASLAFTSDDPVIPQRSATPPTPVSPPVVAAQPETPTSPSGSRGFRYIEDEPLVTDDATLSKRKDPINPTLYDLPTDEPHIPAVKSTYTSLAPPLQIQDDTKEDATTPKQLPLPLPTSPTDPVASIPPSTPTINTQQTSPTRQPPVRVEDRIQTPLDSPLPPAGSVTGSGWGSYLNNQFDQLSIGGESPGPASGWRAEATPMPHETEINPSVESSFVNGHQSEHEERERELQREREEEERDNMPLAHANGIHHRAGGSGSHSIQPVFQITVEDPQKVGADPIRAYTMYTVHTRTTSPLYNRSSFTVLRRYSDFVWLFEILTASNPGVVVPPIPDKNPFGRFQDTFVEQRRLALQQCIQKIANHPVLCNDEDLKFFLESDNFALDMKHRKSDGRDRGLISSFGSSIVGTKFYEIDEWFDQKKAYLDSLEGQLKGLAKAIDFVAKNRQELSIALNELSHSLSELSVADLSKHMTFHIASLSDVERKSKEMHDIQAREDTLTIMNTVDEYVRLIASVRLAFASRVRVYTAWQAADKEVRRVRANQDAARRQGRLPNDRASFSLGELQDAERKALDTKQEFDKVSRLIKVELARFDKERIEDFKTALESLLHGMIARQKDIIRSWEIHQEQLLKRVNQQQEHEQQSQGAQAQQEAPPSLPPTPAVPTGLEETDVNPFAS